MPLFKTLFGMQNYGLSNSRSLFFCKAFHYDKSFTV